VPANAGRWRAPEAQSFGALAHADAVCAEQNDPRAPHEAFRRLVLAHDGFATAAGVIGQVNGAATQRAIANRLRQVMMIIFIMLPCRLHKRYQDFHSAVLDRRYEAFIAITAAWIRLA
jgi:hypothetical protein